MTTPHLAQTLANLDAWFDAMRLPGGYGGPVVHWWQNCLTYTGAGLDWRYEGIILGYLALYRRTGLQKWLHKARRAGDDLVQGQLPASNFRASSFEQNPYPAGTPHEAAADLALLQLAGALRDAEQGDWQPFAAAAERNLRCYYIEKLWDGAARSFRDDPHTPSLVPNKACTLVQALFAWAHLEATDEPIVRFALPTLEAVLALQVTAPGRLHGAIAQNSIHGRVIEKYFPYYIARCIPALLLAYDHTNQQRWLDAAAAALAFISRQVDDHGFLPQVLYRSGVNHYPQWLAPLGDVLHAARLLQSYGVQVSLPGMHDALLSAAQPAGGFATARGFGAQISQRSPSALPDFRDNIPVAGSSDKAFLYLALKMPASVMDDLPLPDLQPTEIPCRIAGKSAIWLETATTMTLTCDGATLYRWSRNQPVAAVTAPQVMLK